MECLAACAAYKLPPLFLNKEDAVALKTFVSLCGSVGGLSTIIYTSIICPLYQKNCKWKFHKCSRSLSFAVCSVSSAKVLSYSGIIANILCASSRNCIQLWRDDARALTLIVLISCIYISIKWIVYFIYFTFTLIYRIMEINRDIILALFIFFLSSNISLSH